ncbi:MAG: transcription elongation factor GreA [Candidatus Pacebacteria bacterium]|jgi:transcription elongation factor GreA|nr:transcription elongation factor GreA [Candidatus Paceibacterota bacterium]MDD3072379.1 transcription elongation factor GreA [Candidatus Paceibacterota bacterium]MDD3728992.1 transcription elongation factor GreA [Candidatus Paceibacterota bacterium]MDD4201753.1 transcription elongation factor GreA [Candidatus Paceibacterota bacterium]MDD4467468.1 transcription elongation factor GreA [Candidatus Paceibacterota bacterium]
MAEKYFTKEGLEKINKELEYLKTEKRKDISKRIKEAASFGDLSENAAYTEAKEEQAFLEGRIRELENKVREAKVVEKGNYEKVEIGSTIVLSYGKEEISYTLVDTSEADPFKNKISFSSPLGEKLFGKRVGDSVELSLEEGKIKYTIKEIK